MARQNHRDAKLFQNAQNSLIKGSYSRLHRHGHVKHFMSTNEVSKKSHAGLLSQFHSIVTEYVIMLSEKKMEIGVDSIDFLGMKISDGTYQPQPHVAQELHKFPEKLTSQKESQQFLGLVNYMDDFLRKLSSHTVHMFPMLKKDFPPWTDKQTLAVKAIKQLADVMPPLTIPTAIDKRILQTVASDE
ncbi:uncharacterized protein LOC112499927 [Cynara cardunculus var. scolymus]|uniref:uncharacterized protein LOC112499927 n=1 Tax=Cynara cardunculus var. scolymus TaxID=59895 RepID=UPI000D62FF47|nr:uncharacterized protein LOC112499927 [Cynara cardunculus var. scolymus]